jgi:hypothetical protein
MGLFLKGIAVCDGCQTTQEYKVPAPDGRGTWTASPKGWRVVPLQVKSADGQPVAVPSRIFCLNCLARAEASAEESRAKDDGKENQDDAEPIPTDG